MDPPYYILFSTQSSSSTSLGHPVIQYHYADDSPLSLLPQYPDEHVLLLEYEQDQSSAPTVKSTSISMAVTGVKVEEAPGAAAAEEKHNDRMYIIETTTNGDEKSATVQERRSPQSIISQFKQRNLVLRRALTYPEPLLSSNETTDTTRIPPPGQGDGNQSGCVDTIS